MTNEMTIQARRAALKVQASGAARTVSGLALAAVLVSGAAGAQQSVATGQQSGVPDAQVESNVLRALASAPELSTQNIQSTTVYGVVTLSGNVHDEALRTRAENLAARANGVKKVVDQLTLGDEAPAGSQDGMSALPANAPAAPQQADAGAPPAGEVLQSDGTYAPANGSAQGQDPAVAANTPQMPGAPEYPQAQGQSAQDGYPQQAGQYPQNQPQQGQYPQGQYPQGQYPQGQYPQQAGQPPQGQYPQQPGQYPQGQYPQGQYPQQADGQYPQQSGPNGYPARRPMYNQPGYAPGTPGYGQVAGREVIVPAGAPLQIRINRGLRSDHVQPGTTFTGQVMADVVAGGAVAIPRGAEITGVVVDAEKAGALKGRGELALQLTGLTLGGQQYTLVSDNWVRNGVDKTGHTVASGAFGGIFGALVGAAVGGGAGAAIGAGVGAGAGVASSAATPVGNVAVPPEALLNFKLAQPLAVTTVGQAELQRLAYGAGPYAGQPAGYYRRPYYAPYPPAY